MTIEKIAKDGDRYKRPLIPTNKCRSAIEAFLRGVGAVEGTTVLAPAYIGWSPKEGSGIHDPIEAAGANLAFYRIGRDFAIDLEDLENQLKAHRPKVVLFVHYFGFPSRSFPVGVALAREHGAYVLEDEAHALLSDLIGGACGRLGDAAVFSLHKLLPFPTGGAIAFNSSLSDDLVERVKGFAAGSERYHPFDYDLQQVAGKRLANSQALLEHLKLVEGVTPVYEQVPEGVIPQTLPVLIEKANRDELYQAFNEAGYGGVSLYHTMIEPISKDEYPDSHWLARRIFNLPVHQDMSPDQAAGMIQTLNKLVNQ